MTFVLAQGSFGSFWSLIANSGPVAHAVLVVLLFFSVFSWAIMVQKIRFFREVEQQSEDFYGEFRKAASLSRLYQDCHRYPKSPLAGMFRYGYEELNQQMGASAEDRSPREGSEQISLRSLNGLQRTIQKSARTEMAALERSLVWLATTGTVTPFIGLFGTVVGIINAFQGLGEGSVTTIQAVAPGISEALVATAGGLFAAIPAVIGYNHFLNQLKLFGIEMDDFAAEFLNAIERSFFSHGI